MTDDFNCLKDEFKDRYDFQYCLSKIKEIYLKKAYVEIDDICRFLHNVQDILYDLMDNLTLENDQIGASIVLDNVFDTIITIHDKIPDKEDILEEFNVINEILKQFDVSLGSKSKLSVLQNIKDQCKIYQARSIEEIEAAKKLSVDQTITKEDYQFLKEH